MKSRRSILALRYTPVSVAGGVRKAVGGFLRYVQYRDQHLEPEAGRALDAYVRYVAHRDRTSSSARVFGPGGEKTGADRRQFVDYVSRSIRGLEPKWVIGRDGKQEDRQRAVYTFILSPEDWRGLDLRRVARAAMRQLASDAGPGGIGPWFAAEHRNTPHHHVHIVLAARRELSLGQFSTVVVTRERLQRMKEAIAMEIDRQRGHERGGQSQLHLDAAAKRARGRIHATKPCLQWLSVHEAVARRTSRRGNRRYSGHPLLATVMHLRAVAHRYHEWMEQELEQELVRAGREGWVR